MVIKGKARGGAAGLAAHLTRHDTNEEVRLGQFEGVTSRDVLGALREMDAMGSGASSTRTLYHAAINTAPDERLTDDQKRQAIDRLAGELGLQGQPHIVVEHRKKDREHMHVVYLRIDLEQMKAIPDSHNYRKHEIVARDLEREFGHEPVKGAHIERKGEVRPERTPSHAEMQQAERSGQAPHAAKEEITKLWRQADSGRAFAASVSAEGWVLAKGDKRDFVLVDRTGETHSLARRVDGVKAADIRQRMSDVDPAALPSVNEAKQLQRHQAEAGRTKEKEKSKAPHGIAPADPVLLKVEVLADRSPAEPLAIAETIARPIAAKPAPAEKPIQTPLKPALEQSRQRTPLQRLYTVATETTQRVVAKARGVLDKKELQRPIEKPAPAPAAAKPAPQLTPAQLETNQKRETAKALDRQAFKDLATDKPPQLEQARTIDNESDRVSGRKRKLSRDEIEMLAERQRRQREISGPSR